MNSPPPWRAQRGWSRPITLRFTNWLTVDPLKHPSEVDRKEDLVTVDPMHLDATRRSPGSLPGFIMR